MKSNIEATQNETRERLMDYDNKPHRVSLEIIHIAILEMSLPISPWWNFSLQCKGMKKYHVLSIVLVEVWSCVKLPTLARILQSINKVIIVPISW